MDTSVSVKEVFPKSADIKEFLLQTYSVAEMDLRMSPEKSKSLSARDWVKAAADRWTGGKDIASMPMPDFCEAMGLHGPLRAPSPAAEGEEEAEGEEKAPPRALSPDAGSAIIVESSEDERSEPAWPWKGYNDVTSSFSTTMLSTKKSDEVLYGAVGPYKDKELVQQMSHLMPIAKNIMPESRHRHTLSKLGMLYIGASDPNDRVKALVCYKHLSVLSRPYVSSKSGAVPHRFCYKEADTEWHEDCCKMG